MSEVIIAGDEEAVNASLVTSSLAGSLAGLNVPYAACETLVAFMAVVGNGLVVVAFKRERRLRRRTNYYIVSLAVADLLVGLFGIPFALLAYVGLPSNLYACLFTMSLLVVLCTISIFCLVAVSVDRYWAILHPLGYSRNVSTNKAVAIICACWAAGTLVGFLPLLGWHRRSATGEAVKCYFTRVMDYDYLVFLYFSTIIFPALLLAAFYAHIYHVVLKQLRRMECQSPGVCTFGGGGAQCGGGAAAASAPASGGTMLRVLGAARKREVKATKNLSVIVLFFALCWFPLYTINCVQAFCPECIVPTPLLDCCIILSHLNSAGNPLLYAYHLKDFRAALRALLFGPGSAGSASALDLGPTTAVSSSRCAPRGPLAALAASAPSPVPGGRQARPLARVATPSAEGLAPAAAITGSKGDHRLASSGSPSGAFVWSLQPRVTAVAASSARYVPAPASLASLSPSRSTSDLGSAGSASDSGQEAGHDDEAAAEDKFHLG